MTSQPRPPMSSALRFSVWLTSSAGGLALAYLHFRLHGRWSRDINLGDILGTGWPGLAWTQPILLIVLVLTYFAVDRPKWIGWLYPAATSWAYAWNGQLAESFRHF